MKPPNKPAPKGPTPSELIEAAAAAWLSLRDRGMSPEETASFLRWMQRDPRHAEVFNELDRAWTNLDKLSALPAGPSGAAPDPDLLAPRARVPGRRNWMWASVAAAAAIAVVALVGVSRQREPAHTAETEVGAFRKLDLPDGSVVQLNTDSAIDTAFSATERRVRIARGEAFFTVAKDAARPFIVSSGPIAVRAVGTAFNVRRRADGVEVLVTEGRVRVDDTRAGQSVLPAVASPTAASETIAPPNASAGEPLLTAGDRAWVPVVEHSPTSTAMTAPPPITPTVERMPEAAMKRALAWQERRLEFDAVPLAQVVSEFNRYNRRQLVIADPALAARRFSGVFRADGYESFVRLLETDFGVSVTHEGREITLRVSR